MKAIAKRTALILGLLLITAILFNLVAVLINGPWNSMNSVGLTKKILVEEEKQLPVASVGTFTGDHADIEQNTTIPRTEKQLAPSESREPLAAADKQDDDFDRKARELAKAFRTADPETQARLRKELDALNERHFEYRQQQRQQDIDRLTSRLNALSLLQSRRFRNKAEVLKRRLDELLDPNSDLEWGGSDAPDPLLASQATTEGRSEEPATAAASSFVNSDDPSTVATELDDPGRYELSPGLSESELGLLDQSTRHQIEQLRSELSETAKLIQASIKRTHQTEKRNAPAAAASYTAKHRRELADKQQDFDQKSKQLKALEQLATPQPRYEGLTLDEWLRVLKTERSLAKLKTALAALQSLKQDAEPRTLIRAVIQMSQSLSSFQANGVDIAPNVYSITAGPWEEMLIDELLAELNHIPPRNPSRGLIALMTTYFASIDSTRRIDNKYSTHYFYGGRDDSGKTLRTRAGEILSSFARIAQRDHSNDEWVVLNAYYILGACQRRLPPDSDLVPSVERVFSNSTSPRIKLAAGVMLGESDLHLDEVTEFFRQALKRNPEMTQELQFTCDRIEALTRTQPAAAQLLIDALEERVRSFGSLPSFKLDHIYILAHTLAEIGEPATAAIPVLQTLHGSDIAENEYHGDNPRLHAIQETRSLILRDHIADAIKQIQEAKPKPELEPLPNAEPSATLQSEPSQDAPGPARPAENNQTPEMTFDGIPYSQWLKLLETERKPEKLAAAMQACSRLLKPGDERRVARGIFLGALAFEKGEQAEQDKVWSAGHDALKLIPSDVVIEELLKELRVDHGNRNWRHFQYRYFLTEVADQSSSLMRSLKTHPDDVLNELVKIVEEKVEGADSLLAAASTILRVSGRSLNDFKALHTQLLKALEEGPVVPIKKDANVSYIYHWTIAMQNLVRIAPDTPDLAFKLMKHERENPDVIGLVGMLKRHGEPVVTQLVELFLKEWKQVETAKMASDSSSNTTNPGATSPQDSYYHFNKRIRIIKTIGEIGVGPSGYALLRQLSLIEPASDRGPGSNDKPLFDAVESAMRSFLPEARTDAPQDLLSDASLITGRWTLLTEKPGDEPRTCLIESRFMSTYDHSGKQVTIGGDLGPTFGYELDASTSPKQISLYYVELLGGGFDGDRRPLRREIPGTRRLGIYELTETKLRLQFSNLGEPRPAEFVSDQSQLPAGQNLLNLDRKLDERLLTPIPE